jgi:hypothetical protein
MKCTLSIFLVLIFTFQSVQSQVTDSLTAQSIQEMYDFYSSNNKKLKKTGWILLGSGVVTMGVGFAMGFNEDSELTGSILMTLGLSTTISSIPVFIIAKKIKEKQTQF